MNAWVQTLTEKWAEEDRRAAAGTTTCCGRRDFVVIYKENGKARVRCRRCIVDSTVTHS